MLKGIWYKQEIWIWSIK